MDKNEFKLVDEINGFDIREKEDGCYRVFHSDFAGVYIIDFEDFTEACKFCQEEDANDWAATLSEV